MYLGIDLQSGLVYEGNGGPVLPAVPTPVVTQAKLIEVQEDWASLPSGITQSPFSWVFREDTFDSVTRTRRGKLYQPEGSTQPSRDRRVVPHPFEDPFGRSTGAGGKSLKELYVYTACVSLLSKPRQGMGSTLALGTPQAASGWRIIQTEVLAGGNIMVTLKSLSAFGILPDIAAEKIPAEFRESTMEAVDRVLNSAFRESPISVIDHCRNAVTMLLSRWLVNQGHDRAILGADLGKVAEAIGKAPHNMECVSQLARVVARLHARGKGNEVYSKGLRDPVEEDAELALHALGFVLRDIGWTTSCE